MRRTSRILVVALAGAVLLAAAFAVGVAAGPGKPHPTTTAIIDLQKVVANLEERRQMEADFRTRAERLDSQAQDKKKVIDDLQRDLKDLAVEGTASFKQKQDELTKKLIEYQVWHQIESQKLAGDRNIQSEKLYKDIVDAAGQLAKENGYDLILVKQVNLNLPTGQAAQPNITLPIRSVVWAANDLDVTDQLIQMMNNQYKNMVGNTAPAPAPAPK